MVVTSYPERVARLNLPTEDGLPMDSEWHRRAMNLLIDCIDHHREGREDYYCGGNMFIYFSMEQARKKLSRGKYRGPDFFFVKGVPRWVRPYYVVWEEDNRYPNVIIELLSRSTRKTDLTVRKDLFEKTFKTPDYFCYDPDRRELLGWRLGRSGRYVRLKPNEQGWLWSEELNLWVGEWEGRLADFKPTVWLRFYDRDARLVLQQSEAEKIRADEMTARVREQAEELQRLRAELRERRRNGQKRNGR